jgi:hypothetical protein
MVSQAEEPSETHETSSTISDASIWETKGLTGIVGGKDLHVARELRYHRNANYRMPASSLLNLDRQSDWPKDVEFDSDDSLTSSIHSLDEKDPFC